MKILSINSGSSSLKFKLYNIEKEETIIYGYIDEIGANSTIKIITQTTKQTRQIPLKNHQQAVKILIDTLKENNQKIQAIGHRIVNGAGKIKPEIITEKVIERLENTKELSVAHMQIHIDTITAIKEKMPNIKQIAIYDTAFHHTIKEENYLYPVPLEWNKKYNIRKFGFHGISCKYITKKMEKKLNKKPNLIICHIGNGSSITAIENGKSIDTSMGFTANSGLMMGTRSGDIDYSIIPYIMKQTNKTIKQIDEILNKESGLIALAGVSDNRQLEKLIENKNPNAILANKIYINKITDYIAKYYLKLNQIDAIVLCGGVGENAIKFREELINKLKKLNIHLDQEKNKQITKFSKTNSGIITTNTSQIPCYVIPTDEELMIAKDTYELLKKEA